MLRKILLTMLSTIVLTGHVSADDEGQWWGYYDGSSARTVLGTEVAETYDIAMYVPGNQDITAGKDICGIRFCMRRFDCLSNLKIWIAPALPTGAPEEVEGSKVWYIEMEGVRGGDEGRNQAGLEYELPFGSYTYTIPGNGVYVGYTFTVDDLSNSSGQYPVVTSVAQGQPGCLFMRTSQEFRGNWVDGQERSWGCCTMRVLLKGADVGNAATAADFAYYGVALGGQVDVPVTITNLGTEGISSLDYTIGSAVDEGTPCHLDFDEPFSVLGGDTVIIVPFQADEEVGVRQKVMRITHVNGVPNEIGVSEASGMIETVAKIFPRSVLVEELTGTGCSWCPRGMLGMELLRQNYGLRVASIALHQYNQSDAMFLPLDNYAYTGMSGAPICQIDRSLQVDPRYGTHTSGGSDMFNLIDYDLNVPPHVGIDLKAEWNDLFGAKSVSVTATLESLDGGEYGIEYIVVADSLTGTGNSWDQQNSYATYDHYNNDPLIDIFCRGGQYGQGMISGWKYNDVAVVSSYSDGTNQARLAGPLVAGVPTVHRYTLNLPRSGEIASQLHEDNLAVVAIVISSTGEVVNAAKVYLNGFDPSVRGIEEQPVATPSTEGPKTYYSLNGQKVNIHKHGLTIVRYADGHTEKILE